MTAGPGVVRVLLIGAGGHASVVADIVLRAADAGEPLRLVGYLDDESELHGTEVLGYRVLGAVDTIDEHDHDALVVALGDNRRRADVIEALAARGHAPVRPIIHPGAVVAADVEIGAGAMVAAGVVINPGAVIGNNAIINTGATIDHHCVIGPCAHVAPGAHLGGNVRVGAGALLGIGCAVTPGCVIGDWAVVGAGAAVVGAIGDHETVVGVPARPLKRSPEGG